MSDQICNCGRPTSGANLCTGCIKTLDIAIANIAAFWDDLETVQTKRARFGTAAASKGSIGKAQPLPIDARFADVTGSGTQAKWDAWNTIVSWCKVVMEEQPQLAGPTCANCLHVSCAATRRRRWPLFNTVPSMCAYLDRQSRWIIREQYAADVLDELTHVENTLRRIVDRPADRVYIGACTKTIDDEECGGAVYAIEGDLIGTCDQPDCDGTYDVAASRASLEEALDSRLCTAAEIARLATYLGLSVPRDKVRRQVHYWARHKRIAEAGHADNGDPMYRYGDVRARLYAEYASDTA